MKKYLIMISAFVLTTVSGNQLVESMISTNILKPIIKNENKELKEFTQLNDKIEIDFNEVENYFKDEKNKTNNKFNGINSLSLFKNKNVIDTAFAKGLEYTREFKTKNMSLNEIITKFQNEIPKFKTVFERELNKQPKKNPFKIKMIYENKLPKFNNEEEKKLKSETVEFWNQLNNIKKVLASSVAIAAIAAAGFWAAAWLGGISIPWAVAATTATATMGVMLSALNIYLSASNPYMNKILQGIAISVNAGLLVYEFVSTVIKVFTISTIILCGVSVIMPTFTAVFSIVIALYYWVNETDIFKQLENTDRFNEAINDINSSNKKKKFDYNFIHDGTGKRKKIIKTELLDWTKYSSSKDEFLKNSKYLFFSNSMVFLGDKNDNKIWNNISYKTNDINIQNNNTFIKMFEFSYNPWWVPCAFMDRLSFNIYFEYDKIKAEYEFAIGTSCWQNNYIRFNYDDIFITL